MVIRIAWGGLRIWEGDSAVSRRPGKYLKESHPLLSSTGNVEEPNYLTDS